MRPVLALAALAALLSGFLAACSDDDPLRLSESESASFSVRPQLSRFGASEMLPINLIRLTVVSLPDSAQVIDPVEFDDIEPTAPFWNLHLDVPLPGGQPIEVLVFVELINETDGVRTIEWSGVAGPFSLEPGETAAPPTVEMFRGSVANLAITALTVAGSDTTTEGATLVLRATAVGASSPQFFWSSLDSTVVALGSAAADSATFLPLAPGLARIVVEAGPRADTLDVQVHARVTALALSPAVDTLTALLASATFGLAALDARGDTVPDAPFVWSSSDSTIARSLGGGLFEARAQGTVTITATTPLAPALSASAELAVRQDVASIVVSDPADTLAAGESSVLTAVPVDANSQPVEPATLTWSSADSGIVAIDSVGTNAVFVTARAAGTALIEASLDGQSGIIIITVVPGTVASVVVTPDSLTFDRLDASAQVSADVRDAEGNATGDVVVWSSTNATIAAVDATGRVDADGNGTAHIVASVGAVADTVVVVVRQSIATVDVVLSTPTLSSGGSEVASASAFDAGGAVVGDAVFAWSSSDTTVATVDASGTVAARLVGSAWIRATSAGVTDSAQVTVIAGTVATVDVTPDSLSFATLGATDTLTTTSRDAFGNDCGCTAGWLSRDVNVASVDANGVVTSIGNGTTWIVADVAGVTDSAVVDVQQVITAVAMTLPLDTMGSGAVATATAVATDAAGDTVVGASFAWSSGDSLVATVDAVGVITAGVAGTAWIQASAGGHADSALVTVIVPAPAPATIAWTGATSADWFTASNWNTGVLPTPADTAYVFASAPFQPTLAVQDSIAGLIVESGAALTLNAARLVVQNHVDAGSTILGTGAVRVRGGVVSGGVPNLEIAGQVAVADTLSVTGDLGFVEDFAELHVVFPTTVTGSVTVGDDAAFLHVGDSLDIGGTLQVGATGLTAVPELEIAGVVVVRGSLLTTGNGRIEMFDPLAAIRVLGDASFESTFSSNGYLTQGTLAVGGDLRAIGAALHATGTTIELNAAVDQHIALTDAGPLTTQARVHDLAVRKAGGVVYVESDLYLGGSLTENAGYPVLDTAQVHTIAVTGDVNVVGGITTDSLRVGGALAVGGIVDVMTVEFNGVGQLIPSSTYQNVLVSGSGAAWAAGDSLAGTLAVTGDLALGGTLEVLGTTTIAGALTPAGFTLGTGGLSVVLGSGLIMTSPADSVIVHATGAAAFLGGSSMLAAGTLLVESGGSFHSIGPAFRATGTTLHMRGASLDMEDAGPGTTQGQLASLVLESPGLLLDSAYVSGDVTEAGPSGVSDAGGATWRALLEVGGSIATPNTGYALNHISVGGALGYNFAASDVDMTQFTGTAQTIPVVDSISQPLSHGTILVTGTDVHLGSPLHTEFLDIGGDVIVSGPGALLTIHSNDNGFVGSLQIVDGDATTRVVIHDGISVRDSVVVGAGVLSLAGQSLTINSNGFGSRALHTSGTGVIELNEPFDELYIANGSALFEGGNTGVLTAGTIQMADSTRFYSIADAFRSSGTALVHRGDSIHMQNVGPNPGQGRLTHLQYASPELNVTDTLYVDGDIHDAAGAMLHDPFPDDAVVVVTGDLVADSSQVVIPHVVVGGDLLLTSLSNWAVGTTEFNGTGQVAPIVDLSNLPISYGTVVFSGDSIDFGTGVENAALPTSRVIVRGPGSTLRIRAQEESYFGSLVMEGGDALQRVRLEGYLRLADSLHVASGVFDVSGMQVTPNGNGGPVALRTTGTGVIEMNQPSDLLSIGGGDIVFEGGSTAGLLTAGTIDAIYGLGDYAPSFHATGAAFHSTGTNFTFDGDSIVFVDGANGRFAGFTFGAQPQSFFPIHLAGDVVVGDSIADRFGSGNAILGAPGSSLTVLGQFRTRIADLDIPRIVAHQNLQGGRGSSVDVVELVGIGQTIGDELAMIPDTILVNGTATLVVDTMAFPADTLAGTLLMRSGAFTLANGGAAVLRDSVVIEGGQFLPSTSFVTIGSPTLFDGGLVTRTGGTLRMTSGAWVTVNGDVEFTGGSTSNLMTAGQLHVAGDFYAENGAFQASGSHLTVLSDNGGAVTVRTPTAGAGTGQDHFRHLRIATNNITNIATDVYVVGVLSDWSDAPASGLYGSGQTIHSAGWALNSGAELVVRDVTLELDTNIDPSFAAEVAVNGLTFIDFPTGGTRLRVMHPGLPGGLPIGLRDVDFNSSTGTGIHVEAFDLDGVVPDQLVVTMEQQTVNMPPDFRTSTINGAIINTSVP